MEENSVVFKGTAGGLTIVMKEEEDFESILAKIEAKIASAQKFFKGASLAIKYKGKKLSKKEENDLFNLLSEKSGAEIKSIEEEKEDTEAMMNTRSMNTQNRFKIRSYFFRGIEEGITKFYKGTVRSGQLISFDGNVVIIGDVNPGGVVEATGNVVVMGSLKGIVHAGADGNKSAVIAALDLQPMQLRIADIITRSPDEKELRSTIVPEIAYIKDDCVYIESYLR